MKTANLQKKNSGVTMIELLIVLMLMGVMASLAMPSLGSMVKRNHSKAAILSLYNTFSLAQNEASRQRQAVTVVSNQGWQNGWRMFSDFNRDQTLNGDDQLLHVENALSKSITFNSNNNLNHISFLPRGDVLSSSTSTIQFFVCTPKQDKPSHVLKVQPSGNLIMIGNDNALSCS